MVTDPVSTAAVDYLQRVQMIPTLDGGAATAAPLAARRIVRVVAVGQPTRTPMAPAEGVVFEPATLPLLVGLAGAGVPVAFLLEGRGQGVSVRLGTWAADGVGDAALDARQATLLAILDGAYPVVDIAAVGVATPRFGYGAFGLGVPSPATVDPRDGALPIDRLLRSVSGLRWAALVLACPVGGDRLGAERNGVLNEMRAVAAAAEAIGMRSPLAEHYLALLHARLAALAEAQARGGWRTAVYLLGETPHDVAVLASAWRAVFSGARSVPEPVRTVPHPWVADLAANWALPDDPEYPGPGGYRHPYAAQTLLSSPQLAAYLHLPALETAGFGVRIVARFDSVPTQPPASDAIAIGKILQFDRDTGADYRLATPDLTRHTFVAGVTGSGKTNTIMQLLTQADARGVPFLIIEPAKKEYRSLIDRASIGPRVRVFTAGQAMVSPFLLNPLEVPPGVDVGSHIDLLRAVFGAAFAMWGPLPQILERCLHEVYTDRGWDLESNTNRRLAPGDATEDAFPTLSDLVVKVGEVVPTLGYETVGDLEGALVTRLDSLRKGAKGSMLDVTRSLPWDALLSQPTVIELEAMGDEGDKAFVAGLLVIRLVEYRRALGQAKGLLHLLVIEEAHRLLGNVSTATSEHTANPRGHAVETFSNLLSEIRAYGQGVVIADQVPVRLAPDVMKNTNLKIAHRIVSADDRLAMGGTMAMTPPQTEALTTLGTGRAAVFSSGDDAPLVVQVPAVKDTGPGQPPTDDRVRDHMAELRAREFSGVVFRPRPFCTVTCGGHRQACELARRLSADPRVQQTFGRLVLSTFEQPEALDRLWEDLLTVLRARQAASVDETALLRAFAGHGADWLVHRRGAPQAWSYGDASELRHQLQAVLLDKVDGQDPATTRQLRSLLQATAVRLHARRFDPYPACSSVCTQTPAVCMFRSPVADLVRTGRYQETWQAAGQTDDQSEDGRQRQTWSVIQDAAYELIEFPADDEPADVKLQGEHSYRRVALCFEQQMLADDVARAPMAARRTLASVLAEAGL